MRAAPARGRGLAVGTGAGLALVGLAVAEARTGLGGLLVLVGAVPLALALVRGGLSGTLLAAGLALLGAILAVGPLGALAVGARHLVPGAVLGLAVRRGLGLVPTLLTVSLAGLGAVALVLSVLRPGDGFAFLTGRDLEVRVADLERVPARWAVDPGRLGLDDSTRWAGALVRRAAPGVVLSGFLLVALANSLLLRLLLRGRGWPRFVEERVPDHLVWAVVAAGTLLVTGHPGLSRLGLSGLVALLPLYAIQGLAVLRHLFQQARCPRLLQGLGFGLCALQPLLLVAVACLGLTDLWVDFRKLRRAPTPA